MTYHWPDFAREAERFYAGHLARPHKLFRTFVAKQTGSGRPPGHRLLYWQTVVTFSIAALEAGLEDVLFAAHGARQQAEGHAIAGGRNSVGSNPRRWLVEDRLMAPNAQKIDRVLFADFGVLLEALPPSATFSAREKHWSKGGDGKGKLVTGPSDWASLRKYLDTLSYIRNATAHGDATKLKKCPANCEGLLWLTREDGVWSVQMPHALTAMRAVLSTFNAVVDSLAVQLDRPAPTNLTHPDTLDYPD